MMFKSAQDLRTAADMRSLQRVAAPWRQARTSWFDGTPESIEARLAATERVLSHARSGFTAAHLELTREAAAARDELLAAKHRLLTDFLDDGARAFKGSKRVAGEEPNIDDDERERNKTEWNQWAWQSQSSALGREDYIRKHKPWLGSKRVAGPEDWVIDISNNGGETGSSTSLRHRDDKENNRFTLRHPEGYPDRSRVITNHDDTELMSADGMHHWASRRIAGNAEWHARQESERDPEMRGNYYDGPDTGECRHCGDQIEENGKGYGHVLGIDPHTGDTTFYPADHPAEPDDDDYHTASLRTAGTSTPSVGEGGASFSEIGPSVQAGSASASIPGAVGKAMWNGSTMTGQESTPAFNPGPKATTAGYIADFDDQLLFGSE